MMAMSTFRRGMLTLTPLSPQRPPRGLEVNAGVQDDQIHKSHLPFFCVLAGFLFFTSFKVSMRGGRIFS